MAYNNKNNKGNSRLSNGPKYDPNHKRGTPTNNVKGGVFVYTGSITVSELAKQFNQSVSDILKYLFFKIVCFTDNNNRINKINNIKN